MMIEEEHLEQAKQWILQKTKSNGTIPSFTPLLGATSSSLYKVTMDDDVLYVLRLYTNREWNNQVPDLALHEASSLEGIKGSMLQTPQLIAIDEKGKHTRYPAVLMSKVPGIPQLFPMDQEALTQLAETLLAIHSMEVDLQWIYSSYYEIETLQAPKWSYQVELWEKAIEYTKKVQADHVKQDVTFIHRDYHPMNVLWEGRKITGVVDWVNACIGPRGVDVGHCRLNLALLYGVEKADQFLLEYTNVAGDSFHYHPYWDLRMLFEFLPGPPTVYQGWLDVGVTGLTERLMKQRFEAYLLSVWERM
ncbi:Phosphotransferase enzyme family protein [Thermoactinomyces sp. DSM 45891]|uniref:aminoglycoside phosphotransferase family protein n=1 Tax=Thermoactinomyces sp. DSM 45891 TaxID=1761907 RepID=UPI0009143D9E|nr:aminoglycoside phosphotransferase family protein [Thermoactinomyces sp. DSM 45891]SFX61571.1 Phosphotransferase enzyme family protein [Thermoactinomyces sp. DSM 45891]